VLATVFLGVGAKPAGAHNTPAYWYEPTVPALNADWMGNLYAKDSTRKLSSLSIPATHDSGCYKGGLLNGGIFAQTQSMSFAQQLNAGIRAFDLRLGRYTKNLTPPSDIPSELKPAVDAIVSTINSVGTAFCGGNELYVFHNFFCQEITFRSVLSDIGQFLDAHPDEAVFIKLKGQEPPAWADSDVDQNPTLYRDYVNQALAEFAQSHSIYGGANQDPALSDIRGKLVIVSDGYSGSTATAWPGSINWKLFDRQDTYDLTTTWDLASKWNGAGTSGCTTYTPPNDGPSNPDTCNNIVYQFHRANVDPSRTNTVIASFISAASGVLIPPPFFYASGHIFPPTGGDRLWTGWTRGTLGTCGSADKCLNEWYYPSLSCAESHFLDTRTCSAYFEGLNVLTMQYINTNKETEANQDFWGMPVRVNRTGILFTDFPGAGLISAIVSTNYRQYTGQFDVGVIPDKSGCATPESTVTIRMDDEDDDNQNFSSGWIGANESTGGGTTFTFCRVDGANLGPLTPLSRDGDYAVLKLGAKCPPGSREFKRYFENERDDNKSFIIGDAWPNRQNWAGVGTLLAFCEFQQEFAQDANAVAMTDFPVLPEAAFGYGVFARPNKFPKAIAPPGYIHTDDEDFDDQGAFWNPEQCKTNLIVQGQYNTDLWLAKVRGDSRTCGNGIIDSGEACDDGGGVCCSADCLHPAPEFPDPIPCPTGDTCNPGLCFNGACVPQLANVGAPCDDGNPCTTGDTCQTGSLGNMRCKGTDKLGITCEDRDPCSPPDTAKCVFDEFSQGAVCRSNQGCPPPSNDPYYACHYGVVCDANDGCIYTPFADGTLCDDGNASTHDDMCDKGVCVGILSCNEGQECDDGNPCTNNDVCTNNRCTGTPVACPQLAACMCPPGQTCTTYCVPETGQCVFPPPQPSQACDDGNSCTTDTCDPALGCQHSEPLDCDDNNSCTLDFCNGSSCSHTSVACPLPNACQVGAATCNALTGVCEFEPRDCGDGDACTSDSCDAASGCKNTPTVCPPPNACQVGGTCNAQTGQCEYQPHGDGNTCNDGDPCTIEDICSGGVCEGQPRNCNDDDPCTNDSCSVVTGAFKCDHVNCADPGHQCPTGFPQCIPNACGNNRIDPGETCDPPDATPIPGVVPPQVKCRPDCTYCGDGNADKADGETCDDGNAGSGCDPVHPRRQLDGCANTCTVPICVDPSRIAFGPLLDQVDFHGMLTPIGGNTNLDPTSVDFVYELTDAFETPIFRASLESGTLMPMTRTTYRYKNKEAARTGGIASVKIRRGTDGSLRTTIRAYGHTQNPGDYMVTHVYLGADEWLVAGPWTSVNDGWRFAGH
jgi:hypothetical protein